LSIFVPSGMVCSPFGAGAVPAGLGAGVGFFSPAPHPGRIVKTAIPIGNTARAIFFIMDLQTGFYVFGLPLHLE
jgi:hypothetical protein